MSLLLICFAFIIIPPAFVVGQIAKGSSSPYRTVLKAALLVGVASLAVMVVTSMTGESLYMQLAATSEEMAKFLSGNGDISKAFGMEEIPAKMQTEFFTALYKESFKILPVALLIIAAIAAYGEYILFYRVMGQKSEAAPMPKLREFSFPRGAVTGIVIMYFFGWLLTVTEIFTGDMLHANMSLLFDFAFSLQGLSLVLMFFHLKKIPKVFAIVVVLIMWFTYIGRMTLVLLGMMDLLLGLKQRIPGRK